MKNIPYSTHLSHFSDASTDGTSSTDILTTTSNLSIDAQNYLQKIQNIPIEQLAQRADYKSKIATEELLSLSAFIQRALLYLCGIATLSLYLNMLTKKRTD